MYTRMCVCPSNSDWTPDVEAIERVFEFFTPGKVDCLMGFKKPFIIPGSERLKEILLSRNLSYEVAQAEISRRKAKSYLVMVRAEQWASHLFQSLLDYAEKNTYGRYIPCDVSLIIGPNRLIDEETGKTISKGNFRVDLPGDGAPNNMDEYVEVLRQNEHIKRLLGLLEDLSGSKWHIVPVWS